MFQLQDIRKTKVWQEAKAEGREEGIEKGIEKGQLLAKQDLARKLHTSGRSTKEIAQLLEVTQSEVRKWLLDSSLRE